MRFYSDRRDNTPLRYFGRVPVYASTILAVLYVAGLLFTVVLSAAHGPLEWFTFSTERFYLRGWVWQIFTCTFINGPDFFFPFAVIFFYQFSSELEQFFGRRIFFTLSALQLAAIALILGGWRLLGVPGAYAGMFEITVGMFVGFVTLYPNLEFLGWVPMKYVAFACILIDALGRLNAGDWLGLSILLGVCGVSFGYTRHAKLGGSFELGAWAQKLNPFRRRPKFRVVPAAGATAPRNDGGGNPADVDAILDKIARDGFASLTQAERDQLEKAREILNKKRS